MFTRNPRYFRKDAGGAQLPLLDRVVVEIVPDQSAELLRLEAGQTDLSEREIRLEDYAPVKRAADAGRLKLFDVGVAVNADSLWFNLKPGAFDGDPRAAWIQRDELRKAISLAVDRKVFVDTVYLGAGVPVFGPITPGNKAWYAPELPQPAHDPAQAKALLASIGLTDRNGDGTLEDAANRPARFTLLTEKGQTALERGVAVIRDELAKIGLTVDTRPPRRQRARRPVPRRQAVRRGLLQPDPERHRSRRSTSTSGCRAAAAISGTRGRRRRPRRGSGRSIS